jgi:hypothetical protein
VFPDRLRYSSNLLMGVCDRSQEFKEPKALRGKSSVMQDVDVAFRGETRPLEDE